MIGNILRELRLSNGFTQRQISDILNIDRSTYSYYETHKTQPDISVIKRLAAMYDVTTDYILNYHPNNKPDVFSNGGSTYISKARGKENFVRSLSEFEQTFILLLRQLSREKQEEYLAKLREDAKRDEKVAAVAAR